jgi:prophage regulatory protein
MDNETFDLDILLTKHEILQVTKLSYPTVWRLMQSGDFPRSLNVGGRVRWRSSEVQAWLRALPRQMLKCDKAIEPSSKPSLKRRNLR